MSIESQCTDIDAVTMVRLYAIPHVYSEMGKDKTRMYGVIANENKRDRC